MEVGQNVSVGQEMLDVVPLDDIWVIANFKETQLEHMRPGQPVRIKVDAYDPVRIGDARLLDSPIPVVAGCLVRFPPNEPTVHGV